MSKMDVQQQDAERMRVKQILHRAKQDIDQIFIRVEQELFSIQSTPVQNEEGAIYAMFEQELGRLLSPMELETIGLWLDQDGHSPEIIKAALKEAVVAGKVSLRYIDRILFEWKKRNLTSMKQITQHAKQFRERTMAPTVQMVQTAQPVQPPVPFYNWLEERE